MFRPLLLKSSIALCYKIINTYSLLTYSVSSVLVMFTCTYRVTISRLLGVGVPLWQSEVYYQPMAVWPWRRLWRWVRREKLWSVASLVILLAATAAAAVRQLPIQHSCITWASVVMKLQSYSILVGLKSLVTMSLSSFLKSVKYSAQFFRQSVYCDRPFVQSFVLYCSNSRWEKVKK